MRFLIAALLLLAPAQDDDDAPPVRWPSLPATAGTPEGFVPRGWKVEARATGDLDGDGRTDVVLMLHDRDPKLVITPEGLEDRTLDTNPRLLVLALATADGRFRLGLANHSLIRRWTSALIEDAIVEDTTPLAIRRKALSVDLHFFAGAGSWDAYDRTLTFRWQDGRMRLVGFDEQMLHRNTGVEVTTSVDYLTGARIVTTSSPDDGVPDRTRRLRRPPRPLRTLEAIGDGLDITP